MEHDFDECDFPEGNFSHHFYHPALSEKFGKHHVFQIDGDEEQKNYMIELRGSDWFRVEFCNGGIICTSAVFCLEVVVKDDPGRYKLTEVYTSSKEGKTTTHKYAFIDKESRIQLFIRTTAKTYEVTIDKNPPIIYELEKEYISDVHIYGTVAVCSFHEYKKGLPERVDLRIPDFAQIGDIFTFRGKAPKNGNRFAIDFWNYNTLDDADVWFRFCPCFGYEGKNYIDLNTKMDGKWLTETNDKGMPLKAEQPYKIDILVEREHFRCWVNDVEFCTYKHAHIIPFKRIQDIRIGLPYESGVQPGITSVVMTRVNRQVSRDFGFQDARSIAESDPTSVIYFPSIPAKLNLPVTLEPGICISISGVFKRSAQKFKCVIEGEKGNIIYEMEADFSKQTITPFKNYDVPDPLSNVEVKTENQSKPVAAPKTVDTPASVADAPIIPTPLKNYDAPDPSSNVGVMSANQPIETAKVTDEKPSASAVAEAHSQVSASVPSEHKPNKSIFSAAPPFPFKANGHFDMLILVCDGLFNFFVDDKFFYRSQPNDNYKLAKFILFSGDVKIKIVYFVKADPFWVYRLTDKLPKKGHMYYDP